MPTVADVAILAKTLGSILAGKPQSHGALTVIPVLAPMQAEPEWLTLAEAGDRVRITAPAAPGRRAAGGRQAEPHPYHDRAGAGLDRGDHPRDLRGAGAVGLPGPSLGAQRLFPVRWGQTLARRGARPHGRSAGRLGGPSPEGGRAPGGSTPGGAQSCLSLRLRGSFDPKSVVPAMVPELRYDTLAVRDGATASLELERRCFRRRS